MTDRKTKVLRISDPHVVELVSQEQRRTGEGTPTRTAARLIVERLTLLNDERRQNSRNPVAA